MNGLTIGFVLNYVQLSSDHIIFLASQGICGCDRFSSGSIGDVLQTIVKKDGYRGLMRGWIPRMMFHAPAAAICWSTYESCKSIFHEINTNSDNDGGT